MQKLLTFACAGLFAAAALAGCDKGRTPAQTPSSGAAPSSTPAPSSSAAPSPSSTPQSSPAPQSSSGAGKDTQGPKTEKVVPAEGHADSREPAQQRDFQTQK